MKEINVSQILNLKVKLKKQEINSGLPSIPWRMGNISGGTIPSPVNMKACDLNFFLLLI